jgi:hypothetical protein
MDGDAPLPRLAVEGPKALVRRTRAAEAMGTKPRGKQYDDATAVFVRF